MSGEPIRFLPSADRPSPRMVDAALAVLVVLGGAKQTCWASGRPAWNIPVCLPCREAKLSRKLTKARPIRRDMFVLNGPAQHAPVSQQPQLVGRGSRVRST